MQPDPITLSSVARQAVQRQDWARVDAASREILRQDPKSAEGHFLAGLVAKAASKPRVATEAFSKALSLDPARYDAAIELASQHVVAKRFGAAADLLARFTGALDNSPLYLDLAGVTYTEISMPEKAWPLFRRAHELQPEIDHFQSNLASCAVTLGKIDEARALYEDLLKRNPKHQRNHYRLSRLSRAKDAGHVERMVKLLEDSDAPPDRNIFMYYAIGKELEDLERWDEAFAYYKKGGDAVASVARYDVTSDIELVDTIIDTCNADWLTAASASQASNGKAKTPIFVVGLPRTGTTLTERIVSSHSQVLSVGETLFLSTTIRNVSGVSSRQMMNSDMIRSAAGKDIASIADGYLEFLDYQLGAEPLFVEKLPMNYLYLGFAAKAFPDARFVFLNRHPMDACFAMYKQVFTWAYKFSYTQSDLGRYYPAFHRLRQHWRDVLGSRLIEVDYEALVSNQEHETRSLLDRLGLEFEQACLEFDQNEAASATASSVQVRQKIHTQSVGRWRRFEQQLQPLRQQLEAAGISIT